MAATTTKVIAKTISGISIDKAIRSMNFHFAFLSSALANKIISQISIANVATTAITMGIYSELLANAIIKRTSTNNSAASRKNTIPFSFLPLHRMYFSVLNSPNNEWDIGCNW